MDKVPGYYPWGWAFDVCISFDICMLIIGVSVDVIVRNEMVMFCFHFNIFKVRLSQLDNI